MRPAVLIVAAAVVLVFVMLSTSAYQSLYCVTEGFAERKRTILITGSSRGIGFALASRLIKSDKWRVIVHGRHPESVEAALKKLPGAHAGIAADLSSREGCAALFESVDHLDAIVHCAGTRPASDTDWEKTQAVHLNAAVYISEMVKTLLTGPLVLVSSGAADMDNTLGGIVPAAYIMAKAGVEKWTHVLANEWTESPKAVVCVQIDATVDTEFARDSGFESDLAPEPVAAALEGVLYMPRSQIHGRVLTLSHMMAAGEKKSVRALLAHADLTRLQSSEVGAGAGARAGEKETFGSLAIEYQSIEPPKALVHALSTYARVPSDSIAVFPGTLAAIDTILAACSRPQGTVLLSDPEWAPLELMLNKRRIKHEKIHQPIVQDLGNIQPGPDTRAIYLTSPHFLTGRSLDTAAFEDFVKRVPAGVPIIVDQCYLDYVESPDAVFRVEDFFLKYPQVIGVRSCSKFLGLAALRVAYVLAHPEIAAALRAQVVSPFLTPSTVNAVVERCEDTVYHARVRSVIAAERASVFGQLAKGTFVSESGPSVLVELPKGMSWDRWNRKLAEKHIRVAGDETGLLYDKYVHLTIGKEDTHDMVAILREGGGGAS
jgi:histidinol-phosphate/aromatic aminotransferase/cobyric acid decarboxylase-like protein/NAD(P)-dependent dehydrogenase (short-subunit alcohol dehydrogenase family)